LEGQPEEDGWGILNGENFGKQKKGDYAARGKTKKGNSHWKKTLVHKSKENSVRGREALLPEAKEQAHGNSKKKQEQVLKKG